MVVERGRVGWYDVKTAIVYRRFRVPLGNYSWTSSKAKYLWKWSNLETNSFDCKMKSRGQELVWNHPETSKASHESQVSWSLIQNSFCFSILPSDLQTEDKPDGIKQTGETEYSNNNNPSRRHYLVSSLPERDVPPDLCILCSLWRQCCSATA